MCQKLAYSDSSQRKNEDEDFVDEGETFHQILTQSSALGSMHGAVKDFITQRTHINIQLLQKIQKIYNLEGFSGTPSTKIKLNSNDTATKAQMADADVELSGTLENESESAVQPALHLSAVNEIDDTSDLEDEDYTEGVVNMLDFVSELQ
ncbi:hypothetical protein B0H34DRAFT_674051 [Crassisporium funariophilum]|nr:hypothetical protein B0H34DRAFT_674051 [Crassisporium funariophilum]